MRHTFVTLAWTPGVPYPLATYVGFGAADDPGPATPG